MASYAEIQQALENINLLFLRFQNVQKQAVEADVKRDALLTAAKAATELGRTEQAAEFVQQSETYKREYEADKSTLRSLVGAIGNDLENLARQSGASPDFVLKIAQSQLPGFQNIVSPQLLSQVEQISQKDPALAWQIVIDSAEKAYNRVIDDQSRILESTNPTQINWNTSQVEINQLGYAQTVTLAQQAEEQWDEYVLEEATSSFAKYANSQTPAPAPSADPQIDSSSVTSVPTLPTNTTPSAVISSTPQVPSVTLQPTTIETTTTPISTSVDPQVPAPAPVPSTATADTAPSAQSNASDPQIPVPATDPSDATAEMDPPPQSSTSDPQVPTASIPPSPSTADTNPAPVSNSVDPQVPVPVPAQPLTENSDTIAPALDPLVQNQEILKQQQDRQLEEITNRLAAGIGIKPSEVADLSLPEIQEAVRRLDNAKLSQFTDNTLVVPSDAELARREAVLSIQQVQAEINRLKDLPAGQTPAVAAEIAAAERRLGNSLQQVQRASPGQVQQVSITGKETAILTAGAFLASGLLQALKNNNRSVPAPVSPVQNPTIPVTPTAPDAIPLSSVRTEPNNNFVFGPDGELLPADSVQAQSIVNEQQIQERVQNTRAQDIGGDFTEVYDVETGKFNVVNLANNEVVDSGLTQQEAILRAQERSVGDPGYGLGNDPLTEDYIPSQATIREADYTARSVNARAMLEQARQQSILAQQRKASGAAVGDGDWRVRLRLAPGATYLYKTPGLGSAGILEPLRNTDGVVFPYTPRIDTSYTAEYSPYDLTHNNYRGYFYKGSRVGDVILTADFTAQDTMEANYLLAVIHFFKSCTKMFYGQDAERGSPPPLVYLTGLGEYQFNEHACVISNFNYSLPPDVDYIRARSTMASSSGVTQGGNGLMWQRSLAPSATASYNLTSIWARLTGANVPMGAVNYPPAPPNLGLNSPTYVPTKMQMTLTLLPVQSRQQVSQQFSLKSYANGNLLKGGFW